MSKCMVCHEDGVKFLTTVWMHCRWKFLAYQIPWLMEMLRPLKPSLWHFKKRYYIIPIVFSVSLLYWLVLHDSAITTSKLSSGVLSHLSSNCSLNYGSFFRFQLCYFFRNRKRGTCWREMSMQLFKEKQRSSRETYYRFYTLHLDFKISEYCFKMSQRRCIIWNENDGGLIRFWNDNDIDFRLPMKKLKH